MEDKLTNVHDALNNAVFAHQSVGMPMSFRIDQQTKDIASQICLKNGTSLSEFLRQCCVGLVRDYAINPTQEQ